MFDLSWLQPLYLDIAIGVIFLIAIAIGFKDGIVKKLFGLVCFIAVLFLMWFIVPPVAVKLEATGWIQGVINQLPTEIRDVISGLLGPTFYSVIAGAIVLLAFGIIKLIVNFILKKLFKNKGFIGRTLGAVYGFLSAFIASSLVLIVLASPALFGETGKTAIAGSQMTKIVYKGTESLQGVLKNMNLPYDLESVGARALAGSDASKEDIERYNSTISRLPELTQELQNITQNGNVDMTKYVDENGNINQEKAGQLVDDTIVLADLVNKMPEAAREENVKAVEGVLTNIKDQVFDESGKPKQQVNVTSEQKESLNEKLNNLGLDPALVEDLNKCLTVTE